MRETFLPKGAARTKVALAKVRESIRQFGNWPPTSAQRHWVALPMPAVPALERPSQRLARLAHERDLRRAREARAEWAAAK